MCWVFFIHQTVTIFARILASPAWVAVLALRLSVVVTLTCSHLVELVMVENARFAVGISTLPIVVPEIQVLPVWAAIFLLPVVGLIWRHFFELAMGENPRLAFRIQHICCSNT